MNGFPKTKAHKESHERRVKILELKGWTKIGRDWISPYSGCRFDETNAISVEELRRTFKPGYARTFGFT